MPAADDTIIREPARLAALDRTGLLDAPPEEPLDRLTRLASRIVAAPIALVSFVDRERQFFVSHTGLPAELQRSRQTPLSHSFCQHVVAQGDTLVVEDARRHPLVHDNGLLTEHGALAYAGVPVRDRDGHVLGSFCVIDHQPRTWSEEDLYVLRELARSAVSEVELRRALREEERRSRTDPLTGLGNRRAFEEALRNEIARSDRDGGPVGLVLMDIDHFKAINDVYGHAAGDAVLGEVGRRLRAAVRPYDTVARWGGEEFALLLPNVPSERTLIDIADSLRAAAAIDTLRLPGDGQVIRAVRLSAGGALGPPGAISSDELLAQADAALYAAKRRGRDRALAASSLTPADRRAEQPEPVRLAMALARTTSLREGVPEHHSRQVADLARQVARHMGLDEVTALRCHIAGWLHDVGKIAQPEAILSKTDALTDAEMEIMRSHATVGAQLVADLPGLADAAPAVRHHHERFDGTGYPDGLAGEEIPLEARILCAVDAFSAMTNERVHRRRLRVVEAWAELERGRGVQFDPAVVDALQAVIGTRERLPAEAVARAAELERVARL